MRKIAWGCLVVLVGLLASPLNAQQKVVRIGVLHSLSGTMAISETSLRDVVLMAVEEINAKGGVMGYKLEPVVVDRSSGRLLNETEFHYVPGPAASERTRRRRVETAPEPRAVGDLRFDPARGIERGHRVLRDQRDAATEQAASLRLRHRDEIASLECDSAGGDGRVGGQ